jgi:purine-nucleoside phosphorylase
MMHNSIQEAVAFLQSKIKHSAEIALVLGSGLGNFVDSLKSTTHIPFSNIPGFPVSTVVGHSGELVHGYLDGIPVYVNSGRVHFYEGYTLDQVVFPVQVLAGLGTRSIILTNAAGSIRKDYRPGDLMLIDAFLNMTGRSVFEPNPEPQTVFDQSLLNQVMALAEKHNLTLKRGIYAGLNGPSYETPAEIRFLRHKQAAAVGMSTVHEAMEGCKLGMKVLAISCLTNYAAGILDQPLNHEEVMETGRRVRENFAALLKQIVLDIHTQDPPSK